MTARDQQFLALYKSGRFQDQRDFYESRRREFDAARDQVLWLTSSSWDLPPQSPH